MRKQTIRLARKAGKTSAKLPAFNSTLEVMTFDGHQWNIPNSLRLDTEGRLYLCYDRQSDNDGNPKHQQEVIERVSLHRSVQWVRECDDYTDSFTRNDDGYHTWLELIAEQIPVQAAA